MRRTTALPQADCQIVATTAKTIVYLVSKTISKETKKMEKSWMLKRQ